MQHVDARVPALILRAGTTIAPIRRFRPLKDVMLEAVAAVVTEKDVGHLSGPRLWQMNILQAGMADSSMRTS